MGKEYEVIKNTQLNYLNIFLVRLTYRTPHIHRELEIFLILDGELTLRKGNVICQLKKNDIYIVNPNESHEIRSSGNGALILSMQISDKLFSSYFPAISLTNFVGFNVHEYFSGNEEDYNLLISLCIEAAYNYFCHFPNYEFKCVSITNMIMYILHTKVPTKMLTSEEINAQTVRSTRMNRITNYIEENFQHKLLLSDIAKSENLSLTYMSHFFKDSLNMTFQDYLNEIRFEYASKMLETTNMNILDVSIASGFSDIRYLNRLIKYHYDCTPLEYRKRIKKQYEKQDLSIDSVQNFFTSDDSILLIMPFRNESHKELRNYYLFDLYN